MKLSGSMSDADSIGANRVPSGQNLRDSLEHAVSGIWVNVRSRPHLIFNSLAILLLVLK